MIHLHRQFHEVTLSRVLDPNSGDIVEIDPIDMGTIVSCWCGHTDLPYSPTVTTDALLADCTPCVDAYGASLHQPESTP